MTLRTNHDIYVKVMKTIYIVKNGESTEPL